MVAQSDEMAIPAAEVIQAEGWNETLVFGFDGSRAAFDAFAQRHPEVYQALVRILATRLRETDVVIAAGSFLPLKGRVASTLLELAENFGQDVGSGRIVIRQKIGQSDIAAMAGIARENVSRILNDWKRRKLVSRLSGYYCLENKSQLEHEAEL